GDAPAHDARLPRTWRRGEPRGRRDRQVRRPSARAASGDRGAGMNLLQWLYDAQVTIAGHSITWREILGNAFGFASAIGGLRRRVWDWPVGIVGNVLLFSVFIAATFGQDAQQPLFGQAGRQVFFVITS